MIQSDNTAGVRYKTIVILISASLWYEPKYTVLTMAVATTIKPPVMNIVF